MTREEALASLPKKFRKEAARNLSGVRAALKACANEVEAALALPADAPPEQKAPAVETDDQALRLATWFARTYLEPKRVPTYSIEEIARHVAEFAAMRASTPTLTAEDVLGVESSVRNFPAEVITRYEQMAVSTGILRLFVLSLLVLPTKPILKAQTLAARRPRIGTGTTNTRLSLSILPSLA